MKLLRRSAMPMVIISIKYSVLLSVFPLVNIVTEKPFYLLIALLQISDNQLCLGKGGASVGPHRPCLACDRLVVQFIPHLQFLVSFECLKWRFYCYTDNVKLQSEEERRSGRRYFRDVAVLVCFFSSFPLRLPSCSFWKQALLISN